MRRLLRNRTERRLATAVLCEHCGCACDAAMRAEAHRDAERTRLLTMGLPR
jgi:hypothetical protein